MTTKPDTSSRLVLKVEEPIFEWGRHEDYIKRVEQAGLLPVAPLSSAVLQGLEAIGREDQYEGGPNTIMAAARLSDGSYLPRVNFIPERLVRQWMLHFWTNFVKPESVSEIKPSPNRIPLPYRQGIWFVGETSMGSLSFVVTLRDGAKFGCLYSGASDFIELPDPYTPPDIVWCPYQESLESQLERAYRTRNVLDLEEIGTKMEYSAGLRLRAENWLLVIGADAATSWQRRSAAKKAAARVRESLPKAPS